MKSKRNFLKIVGAAAGAVVVGVSILAIVNQGSGAKTSAEAKNENLLPRKYRTSLENFVAETEKIIPTLSTYGINWRLSGKINDGESPDSLTVIFAEVPVFFFTDDLDIKAESDANDDLITVNISSNSRFGINDFGENRRHILQILRALDEKFA